MANYTQYIPQLNSTTYPISISDCFSALTTDVTALENDKLNLTGGILSGNVDIRSTNLTVGIDTNTSGTLKLYGAGTGNLEGGQLDIYPAADYDTTVAYWSLDAYNNTFRIFGATTGIIALTIDVSGNIVFGGDVTFSNNVVGGLTVSTGDVVVSLGDLTVSTGSLFVGADNVATRDGALTDTLIVSADSSGRLTTSSGVVDTDIATISTSQTITGNKTFGGNNIMMGSNTFNTIPAFDGGTSGATPPFTVDSTQLVTNLNADLIDGVQSSQIARLDTTNTFADDIIFTGDTTHTGTQILGANTATSAANLILGVGNFFTVSGTSAISSISSKGVGTIVTLYFTGTPNLSHSAVDLILPGAASIGVNSGDVAVFWEYAVGDWRCISYTRSDTTAIRNYSGTWTPTIVDDSRSDAEGQTYTTQYGTYNVIGQYAHISFYLKVNSLGTLTTSQQAKISGLPFSAWGGLEFGHVTISKANSLAITTGTSLSGLIDTFPQIDLYKWYNSTGSSNLLISEFSAGGEIYGHGVYRVL